MRKDNTECVFFFKARQDNVQVRTALFLNVMRQKGGEQAEAYAYNSSTQWHPVAFL